MKLKNIYVKNFKSFDEQKIDLDDLTIILGANASGKSNTVSIIRFISNIVLYGLDDAISLLGGINYATNATIGKKEPIYLRFVLDVRDEKWVRFINRKEGKNLWLEEIESEFEIIPHKRGMGYRIGEEKLDIKYATCITVNEKNTREYEKTGGKYSVNFERKGSSVKYHILDETSYDEDKLKYGMGADFISHTINEEAKKELVLNRLEFMMPPMFSANNFIKIYDFDPRLMKSSSSITSKRRLEEDGSNIANILQLILRNKTKKRKLINLLCDSLPFIEKIDIQNNVDKSISYRIKEKYSNKTFYSDFLSDGTVNMLALIIALYFEGESGIIIIEEPERNLHPQLMNKIVEMAKEVSKEKQIIITTHNPEMVKFSEIDNILFVQRTSAGYTQVSKPKDNVMVQQFINSDLGLDDLFVKGLLGE